ncbi:arrestin domain-containing protein 3-like [Sinocyclocheilus anshuiensis]|uniref:Arrestin domain-containing protein 3-like n=1 Tax=Sinocyclocheilus anshuiensis TaxID=1608454 RepID=A0A671LLL0_9TELE|nr:PREDICTED: arrestin domain-containing protein 3-like [Sinocyclocheilus anshuiensis]
MTIRNFAIEYDALNDRNTFSNGDTLVGRVIVEVSKETKIKALTVKVKGKADVSWTETQGEDSVTYWDKEIYFSQTQSVILEDNADGSVTLVAGRHVFPFAFQLPYQGLPSSFKGAHGKIHYRLSAKLSRSMRAASKTEAKFTFVARADYVQSTLMAPQHGSKDKNVIFFASGNISMNIFLPKTGYQQGERLVVNGEIVNSSTRKIVPKYIIYQKQSFFAGGQRAVHTTQILKDKGEPLVSSTRQNLSKVLVLPTEISTTIQNCRILKVEYRLKVILDVSFTKNPVIKVPLIVLPLHDGTSSKESEAGLHRDLAKMNILN